VKSKLAQRIVAEGLGTALLLAAVIGSGIMGERLAAGSVAIALLAKTGAYLHPGHFYDFAQSGHLVVSLIVQEQEFAEGIRRTLAHFS